MHKDSFSIKLLSCEGCEYMSYMALYRKFRPSEFEDVKGQEHIVTALTNQIKADRIGHAYLFCGTRGTGKTTIAKLFAKAVNCEHPIDGSPCNECPSCLAINKQTAMNVIEIDAASNNGVDNIRDIRDEVQYSPTEGKYKVYIIDEVHMLSIGAFNALLKTLEEPPSYVIFILATTEAHKIPITILSRCQRYDFRRISIDTITERLKELMEKEGIQAEEKALRYVAKAADGSMRDALSLLDQCIAFYLGQPITYENVLEVLGAVDNEIFSRVLRAILEQKVTDVMAIIEEMVMSGRELGQFVMDFVWYLRNLLLLKNTKEEEPALDLSKESLKALREEAKVIDNEVLMRYIKILSDLSNQLRYATQKRVLTEVTFIRLCKPQMEQSYEGILDRLRQLEEKMEQGVPVLVAPTQQTVSNTQEGQQALTPQEVEQEIEKRFEPADVLSLKQLVGQIPAIKRELIGPMKFHFGKAKVTIGADSSSLNLMFQQNADGQMAKEYFERENHKQEFEELLSQKAGKQIHYQCIFEQPEHMGTLESYDLSILSKLNIPIEFED